MIFAVVWYLVSKIVLGIPALLQLGISHSPLVTCSLLSYEAMAIPLCQIATAVLFYKIYLLKDSFAFHVLDHGEKCAETVVFILISTTVQFVIRFWLKPCTAMKAAMINQYNADWDLTASKRGKDRLF